MKSALVLALVGGYLVWRNRFAIQKQLESVGIKTPILKGSVGEVVHSITSKIGGKAEYADDQLKQKAGNF